jgi:hypothetical protein
MISAKGQYFETDEGARFWPVGHCEHLKRFDGISDPQVAGFFQRMFASGQNTLRIILDEPPYPQHKLGDYGHFDDVFWRVCAVAEAHGVFILPVILFPSAASWPRHAWNKANGGPLNLPWEIYTTSVGEQLALGLVEHVISQHDCPAIFAWEVVNEMHVDHPGWMGGILRRARRLTDKLLCVSVPNVATGDSSWAQWGASELLDFISVHAYWPPAQLALGYPHVPGRTAEQIMQNRVANVGNIMAEIRRKMGGRPRPILDTEVPLTPLNLLQRFTRWPLLFTSRERLEECFYLVGKAYLDHGAAGPGLSWHCGVHRDGHWDGLSDGMETYQRMLRAYAEGMA